MSIISNDRALSRRTLLRASGLAAAVTPFAAVTAGFAGSRLLVPAELLSAPSAVPARPCR